MLTFRRLAVGGLITGIAGAVLGGVVSLLQMASHLPVNQFDQSEVIPFQNFALYMGMGVGVLFGWIGLALFMLLARRYRYPASSMLGLWLGAGCGMLLCLFTNLLLNASAAAFQYQPNIASVLLVNSLITSFVGGVIGLVTGYFMAEIGARNLHFK